MAAVLTYPVAPHSGLDSPARVSVASESLQSERRHIATQPSRHRRSAARSTLSEAEIRSDVPSFRTPWALG